jgi:hypothetical protein
MRVDQMLRDLAMILHLQNHYHPTMNSVVVVVVVVVFEIVLG